MKVKGLLLMNSLPCPNAEEQIRFAFSKFGWSVETLAKQFGKSESEVCEILGEELEKKLKLGDLSTPEQTLAALKFLINGAESEKVQLEAIKFLHQEVTGRSDLPRQSLELKRQKLQLEAVNVGMQLKRFNDAMERAKRVKEAVVLPEVVPA